MYATRYNRKADGWNILQILKKRELRLSLIEELPQIGYVVYEEDHFVAAGFLRKCEGQFGMFDSYVTNPNMPAVIRNQALEMIMKRLLKTSRELRLKQLVGFSLDANTILRAVNHGFAVTEHKVLVKVL